MADDRAFMDHWVDIDPERMERYETMFQWNPATEAYYAHAKIGPGQVVADFGCGPGHAAIEFARRVGPSGRVHAMDINAEFITRTRERDEAENLSDRIFAHLLEDARLPLPDGTLDRVIVRNTIVYVQDPLDTFREFRRTLKPGGIAHAIESDWRLTLVEPVPTQEWTELMSAASWAWRWPEIGRNLYGIARRAGFDDVALEVLVTPDMDGRFLGMIRNIAGYARESGSLDGQRIDAILRTVERGLAEQTYLAVAPQFVVTATA